MEKTYPFYIKSTVILLGLTLCAFILLTLKEILVPIAFSIVLAILLNSPTVWMQKKRIPHTLAIALSMLFAFVIIIGVVYFISIQVAGFSSEMPLLKNKFTEIFHLLQMKLFDIFHISLQEQDGWIKKAESSFQPLLGTFLSSALITTGTIVLMPVYTFLLLYYKKHIIDFFYEISETTSSLNVGEVLQETNTTIQRYTSGLLIEAFIIAVLYSATLLILGVQYAILLGVLGALLNMLPFIGGIVGIALPLAMATLTKDGFTTQILILVIYTVIQFIDNHFIIPSIVSSRVKINALISIIIVLLGGALWGIAGMFLSIPFIGILKIVFDRIPVLQPWGKLLGYEEEVKRKRFFTKTQKIKIKIQQ